MAEFMQAHVYESILWLQVLLEQGLAQHALEHQAGGEDSDLPDGCVIGQPVSQSELDRVGEALAAVVAVNVGLTLP